MDSLSAQLNTKKIANIFINKHTLLAHNISERWDKIWRKTSKTSKTSRVPATLQTSRRSAQTLAPRAQTSRPMRKMKKMQQTRKTALKTASNEILRTFTTAYYISQPQEEKPVDRNGLLSFVAFTDIIIILIPTKQPKPRGLRSAFLIVGNRVLLFLPQRLRFLKHRALKAHMRKHCRSSGFTKHTL